MTKEDAEFEYKCGSEEAIKTLEEVELEQELSREFKGLNV